MELSNKSNRLNIHDQRHDVYSHADAVSRTGTPRWKPNSKVIVPINQTPVRVSTTTIPRVIVAPIPVPTPLPYYPIPPVPPISPSPTGGGGGGSSEATPEAEVKSADVAVIGKDYTMAFVGLSLIAGAAIGFFSAKAMKKNKIVGAAIGAVAVGAAGYLTYTKFLFKGSVQTTETKSNFISDAAKDACRASGGEVVHDAVNGGYACRYTKIIGKQGTVAKK